MSHNQGDTQLTSSPIGCPEPSRNYADTPAKQKKEEDRSVGQGHSLNEECAGGWQEQEGTDSDSEVCRKGVNYTNSEGGIGDEVE